MTGQNPDSGRARSDVQVVVVPPLRRVVRYKVDQVGNDLTCTLMWCEVHHEPVWLYSDGSHQCVYDLIVGWSPNEHSIVSPPWERAQIGYENPNQGRGVDLVRTEGEGASRSVADAGIDGSHDGSDGRVGQDHAGAASEPKPATDGVRASDPPGATTPLGWWAISGEAFLDALRRAHAGDDPDVLYAEHYANSHSEQVDGPEDGAR